MRGTISLFIALAILAIGQNKVIAKATLKIVNGTDAEEGEFPYMVQLIARQSRWPRFACGGTILSPEWILTTGSCLKEVKIEMIASGTNKLYPDQSCDINTIKESFVHPRYSEDEGVSYYDIGLLKLATPLEFTDKVQAVKLPDTEDVPFHLWGTLSGWGEKSSGSFELPQKMQKLRMELLSDEECTAKISGFVPAHHLCSEDNNKGQCSGDSGSPFVIDGVQYGVASWAVHGCGGGPGAYSRLTNLEYRNWIKKVTGI